MTPKLGQLFCITDVTTDLFDCWCIDKNIQLSKAEKFKFLKSWSKTLLSEQKLRSKELKFLKLVGCNFMPLLFYGNSIQNPFIAEKNILQNWRWLKTIQNISTHCDKTKWGKEMRYVCMCWSIFFSPPRSRFSGIYSLPMSVYLKVQRNLQVFWPELMISSVFINIYK